MGEELWGGEAIEGTVRYGTVELEDIVPDGFNDIAVSGHYAYITAGQSGLRVLDVSDPASPREVTQLDIPGAAHHAVVSDNLLYLLGTELVEKSIFHTVYIVDISEPESPLIIDSLEDIPGIPPCQFLVATEKYIYFVSLKTVHVIDIYSSD